MPMDVGHPRKQGLRQPMATATGHAPKSNSRNHTRCCCSTSPSWQGVLNSRYMILIGTPYCIGLFAKRDVMARHRSDLIGTSSHHKWAQVIDWQSANHFKPSHTLAKCQSCNVLHSKQLQLHKAKHLWLKPPKQAQA